MTIIGIDKMISAWCRRVIYSIEVSNIKISNALHVLSSHLLDNLYRYQYLARARQLSEHREILGDDSNEPEKAPLFNGTIMSIPAL